LIFILLENRGKLWIDHWLRFLFILAFVDGRLDLVDLVVFLQKVFICFLHKFLNLWLRNHFVDHLLLKLVIMTLASHRQLIIMSLADCSSVLLVIGNLRLFEWIAWAFIHLYFLFSIGPEPCLIFEVKMRRFLNLLLLVVSHLDENVLLDFPYVYFMSSATFVFDDVCLQRQLPWCDKLLVLIVVV